MEKKEDCIFLVISNWRNIKYIVENDNDEEDEKEIAIFLPLERFRKAAKSKVWSESKGRF